MTLVGVTAATAEETDDYRGAQGIDFSILADAGTTTEAWGVEMIWGNVVRLVNPEGRIVSEGLKDARRVLAER